MPREGIDGVSRFMGMRWESSDTVRLEVRPDLINAARSSTAATADWRSCTAKCVTMMAA